jgi:hypothetical protein
MANQPVNGARYAFSRVVARNPTNRRTSLRDCSEWRELKRFWLLSARSTAGKVSELSLSPRHSGQASGIVFRGSFQGQPFEYSVDFLAKTNRVGSELEGSATINGQQYQWRGTRKASQLRGQYQASNGWNGEIVLNETKTGGRNVPMSVEPESIEEVGIKPIVRDGDHLLFVGNELMENDGGVYNYLQTALRKRGMEVTHPSKIGTGKSLREMLTPESPAGLNFDYPPHLVGQQLQDDPELRMTRELREIPQYRAWDVAQA